MRFHPALTAVTLGLAALLAAVPAIAEPRPSSDLLLPYFEVDLSRASGETTLFAVGNASEEAVSLNASVTTNWGIRVLRVPLELDPGEVLTVNLRDWIRRGALPDGQALDRETLAHLQAALTGQASPRDGLYYGVQADLATTTLAVGAVTFRVDTKGRPDVLWGDYFWVIPGEDRAEGELLVNIDRSMQCRGLCDAHRLRFMNGAAFDGGTQLVVWSPRVGQPRQDPDALVTGTVLSLSGFHRESGARFDERSLDLLPVQLLDLRDLLLDEPAGWLDIVTEEEVYVGVRYTASNRFSATLQTWCMPETVDDPPPPQPRASIDIEKLTNGVDSDEPFGMNLAAGADVTWEYIVTNTGEVPLTDVRVTDDVEGAIACPRSELSPGESMTCTHTGSAPAEADIPAEGFFYANLGTAVGTPPEGADVEDSDPSHYNVPGRPIVDLSVDVEKATNGQDADAAPGVALTAGDAVTWSYVVTNTSPVALSQIAVVDDREGAVTCPKSELAPGESMTCTPKQGVAVEGQYVNLATVTAQGPEGQPAGDADPSHYTAEEPPVECSDCEGKITHLELRYTGAACATIEAVATPESRFSDPVAFGPATVCPGGTFDVFGKPSASPGFDGTLGTNLELYADGAFAASIHTSCSQEVGPGFVAGDFTVVEAESSQGGQLCPLQ